MPSRPITEIYIDTGDIDEITHFCNSGGISGVTTNPMLVPSEFQRSYWDYAQQVVGAAKGMPVSIEVLGSSVEQTISEALILDALGPNVYVKIPWHLGGEADNSVAIKALSSRGIRVNVTGVMTVGQVQDALTWLDSGVEAIISIFAGRIADSGVDPLSIIEPAVAMLKASSSIRLLWASSREIYNVSQAAMAGCDIITCKAAILRNLDRIGRDLDLMSREVCAELSGAAQKLSW